MSTEILAAVITASIIATVCLSCASVDVLRKRRNRAQALGQNPRSVSETSIHLSPRINR